VSGGTGAKEKTMTEDGASTIIDGFTYQRCPELRDYPACIHLQDEIGDRVENNLQYDSSAKEIMWFIRGYKRGRSVGMAA
jgi:hypothetical protein